MEFSKSTLKKDIELMKIPKEIFIDCKNNFKVKELLFTCSLFGGVNTRNLECITNW